MSLLINSREEFLLPNYARVAWLGESVTISDTAIRKISKSRTAFVDLINTNENLTIYGVTSGYGQNAKTRLSTEQRAEHAATPPFAAMAGFGDDLPERLKRGITFCRLANFVEGHAGVTPALAQAVAQMLDDRLPPVPLLGNSSAGEIIPLSHLFTPMTQGFDLAEKETLALINGSPCATALLCDIALATEQRIDLLLDVFALAIEAMGAPLEAYDESLESLYGDPYVAYVLQQLRARIDLEKSGRRTYQAPVSWRIVPQVLGQLCRAHAQICEAASISLKAVTDNPVIVPGDNAGKVIPRVLSNGGYHNGAACMAMDAVAGGLADLATLADRQISKLFDASVSGLPPQLKAEGANGYLGCCGFIAADYAEQARKSACRTPLIGSEGGGFGQNDILIPVFHAWRQHQETARSLDACLAILAVTCSQAFSVSDAVSPSARLTPMLEQVRFYVPPVKTARAVGASIGELAREFSARVFAGCTTDAESGKASASASSII